MRSQAIKRKDLISLMVVVLIIILLSAAGLFFRNTSKNKEQTKKEEAVFIEGQLPDSQNTGKSGGKNQKKQQASKAYFLKPSADEVLSSIREAPVLTDPPEDKPPMKVMWPGYFFQLGQDHEGKTIVELDVDENGFGIMLICTVDIKVYPELSTLESGRKIWIAGEITAIDVEGTGRVYINTEFIRFDEGPPAALRN